MTALLVATSQGHASLVGTIISHYPKCYDLVDDTGWNVLHFLTVSLYAYELNCLLKDLLFKNLIDEKDVKGNTPLHVLANLRGRSS